MTTNAPALFPAFDTSCRRAHGTYHTIVLDRKGNHRAVVIRHDADGYHVRRATKAGCKMSFIGTYPSLVIARAVVAGLVGKA